MEDAVASGCGRWFFENGKATVAVDGRTWPADWSLTPFAGISRIRFKGFLRV